MREIENSQKLCSSLLFLVVATILVWMAPPHLSPGWARDKGKSGNVPKPGQLNRIAFQILRAYPTDGTHRYNWKKGAPYDGVTEDLIYRGKIIARANSRRECYCCGLTFEVFFKAWKAWTRKKGLDFAIGDLDPEELKALKKDWYCSGGVRNGPVRALVSRGLGTEIRALKDARTGDFVQFWRGNGSGHSVIFIEWMTDKKGRYTGMRYWSTQPCTRGIGYRVEPLSGKKGIDPLKIHIARPGRT
jgi:hypothetical protein